MLAAAMLRVGDGDLYVAGGMENMDLAPYLLPKARFGYRLGDGEVKDALVHDGLWCATQDQHMGLSAEWIATEYSITRAAQDEYALESHRRAIAAVDRGAFEAEIVPVPTQFLTHAAHPFAADETPRRDTSLAALAALKPAFREGGTVTAGNSPGITDGAAAVVVTRRDHASAHGLKPLARVLGYAQSAVRPLELFVAPALALEKLASALGMQPSDFDLIELNEAFAAQTVANIRTLNLQPERVNVNGGSIALGHPIGASGARVLTTLLHTLQARRLAPRRGRPLPRRRRSCGACDRTGSLRRTVFSIKAEFQRLRHRIGYFIAGPIEPGLHEDPAARANRAILWTDGFISNASESFVTSFVNPFIMALGATNSQIGILSSLTNLASAAGLIPGRDWRSAQLVANGWPPYRAV